MNWYYLLLDIGALLGPLALSFDKRVRYFKQWKFVFIASLIVAIPFIIHDELFTRNGFWGFNPEYLVGIKLGHLPIEEILFFLIVPFACYFIYACCNYYFRNLTSNWINRLVQGLIVIYSAGIAYNSTNGWYTMTVLPAALITLILWMVIKPQKHIGLAFLISLIPFLLMNGALTGYFTENPVVWYSEAEKIAGRIATIPFEDVLYAFTMIINVILLADWLESKNNENRTSF